MKQSMFVAVAVIMAWSVRSEPVKIIFDTDMYTDFDDVGALACLHALADAGECQIIAVGANTYGEGNRSVAVCEVINAYYGRPDIPVGCARSGGKQGKGLGGYGLPEKYSHWVKHLVSTNAPEAVDVYRKALMKAPDQSVVLCSVGFLTNVAGLLRADPGLVERKVRLWVCMACRYPKGGEYNSSNDAEASTYAFENWPKSVPIIWTDFQYGRTCYSGRAVAELPDDDNPVRDAFAARLLPRDEVVPVLNAEGKEPTWDQLAGHPSWDQTAVLIAVYGWSRYFSLQRGYYRMTGAGGDNVWTDDSDSVSGRVVEKPDCSRADVARIIDELACRKPRIENNVN